MKIKVKPDDFSVNEIAHLKFKEKGAFACYRLEKHGWNTVELLKHLAKTLSLPFPAFAYGGRKDRHGSTWQYITINNTKTFESASKSYQLKFAGFLDRAMGPDLIEANEFRIVARDIDSTDTKAIKESIADVQSLGCPNYFDDQRFGSYDPLLGFLAEKILKGHFNGAAKILLTRPSSDDPGPEKKRKLFLSRHWGQWSSCLEIAKTGLEKQAFSYLLKEPKGFLALLKKIPAHDLSFDFSVYQSYLWNELLRRIIEETCRPSVVACDGKAGAYLFYLMIDNEKLNYLKGLSLPLACAKTQMPDTLSQKLYCQVLADAGIKHGMFNSIKTRQSFFCRAQRKTILFPDDLSYAFAEDDLFRGKIKLTLSFRLAKGSFATMLIKRILL